MDKIIGIIPMFRNETHILNGPRVTHSFISRECVLWVDMTPISLNSHLEISILLEESL